MLRCISIKSLSVAVSTLVLSTSVNAALITNINGLDIQGTLYDVTFYADDGSSFYSLFDANGDGVYDDGSIGRAPTFLGSLVDAKAAAIAIIDFLGNANTVTLGGSDLVDVYYEPNFSWADGIPDPADDNQITSWGHGDPGADASAFRAIATFEVSAVPVPAAAWLFGSGLLGLIGVARRKA